MYVCKDVSMYACMHACMYVCIVCIYACMHIAVPDSTMETLYRSEFTETSILLYIYMYIRMRVSI